ncbi:hypothetical protein TUM4641_25300 [Shewanella morhuae]|nr:hypothetical protein TUM4641_25300 [Shewanella morhuae]
MAWVSPMKTDISLPKVNWYAWCCNTYVVAQSRFLSTTMSLMVKKAVARNNLFKVYLYMKLF